MPRDAKSSPVFHEVRPDTVPLHSFCQILFPIRSASACDNATAEKTCGEMAMNKIQAGNDAEKRAQCFCFLDGQALSISMHLSAPVILKRKRMGNPLL